VGKSGHKKKNIPKTKRGVVNGGGVCFVFSHHQNKQVWGEQWGKTSPLTEEGTGGGKRGTTAKKVQWYG